MLKSNNNTSLNWPLLILAYSSLFFFGLTDNARGPAYPEILKQLDLSNTQGSLLFASSSFLSFILSLLSNTWLKRIDLSRAMKIGLGQLILSGLFMGMSAQFSNSSLLIAASIFQGSGMGMCGVVMNLMVEKASPAHLRRRAFGGLHSTYAIASVVSPLLYSLVTSFGLNWMHFFYFLAAIGPLFVFIPSHPKEIIYSGKTDNNPVVRLPMSLLISLGLCVGMYVASEIVISSRLVLYLEQGHGMTNSKANLYLCAFFIFLMIGRLSVSFFHFKLSGPKILFTSLLLTLIFFGPGLGHYPIFLSLTGLSMSVFFPSYMDWLAENFPQDFPKVTSTVLSGIGLHLVAMHLGFGRLAAYIGVRGAMRLAPLLLFISLVILIIATWKISKLRNS